MYLRGGTKGNFGGNINAVNLGFGDSCTSVWIYLEITKPLERSLASFIFDADSFGARIDQEEYVLGSMG